MKIFIDANVIIDYLVDRMPFADDAEMAERRQQSMTSAQFVDGMIESVENLARQFLKQKRPTPHILQRRRFTAWMCC